MCIYHRGQRVVDVWGGVRDDEGKPWSRDTLCVSFSTTKGVASTALHLLVDRGLVDYDTPVATYWPEFAAAGKASITVRDLMCHRAGLHDIRGLLDDAHQMLDWDHMVAALAAAEARPPQRGSAYHGLTYGHLVGEIIRRVSGMSFSDFVQKELAEPLALDGLHVGASDAALARAARLIDARPRRRNADPGATRRRRNPVMRALGKTGIFDRSAEALMPKGIGRFNFSSDEVLRACIPAANGLFTARSLAKLYAMLANGGELDGVRLLSEETVAASRRVQVRERDAVLFFKMGWRLGYHGVATPRGPLRGAYGHFGYGGSGAWADPRRELAFAMTLNSGTGTPFGDLRIVRMNGIVADCARAIRAQAA